ncbi:MAG TPA: penicillin-insensitive murein endopeptidase [Polyangia bacterium]|nr:penicillin-insensitive murein endopeptidase [Polyangia bacterium]
MLEDVRAALLALCLLGAAPSSCSSSSSSPSSPSPSPTPAVAGVDAYPPDARPAAPPAPSSAAAALARPSVWNAQRTPAPGPPEAIGGYSAGCLQGARALPQSGPGYESLHRSRNRFFGHPALVDFIRRLGATARARHLGVLIVGDMSQARGGPTPSGHRSHQSGLDVDLGYLAPKGVRAGRIKKAERERIGPPAVVDLATHEMSPLWTRRSERLLEAAASDPAVDRIFVNPAIRRQLCASPARHAPWFARLRPWWGHHDHFHVRLKCPEGGALCKPQDPPAPDQDEGCGATLAWWFSSDAQAAQTRKKQSDEIQGPVLPEECAALLAPAPPAAP